MQPKSIPAAEEVLNFAVCGVQCSTLKKVSQIINRVVAVGWWCYVKGGGGTAVSEEVGAAVILWYIVVLEVRR